MIPRYWQLAGLTRTRSKAAVLTGSLVVLLYFTIAPAKPGLLDISDSRTIIVIPVLVYLVIMTVLSWRLNRPKENGTNAIPESVP